VESSRISSALQRHNLIVAEGNNPRISFLTVFLATVKSKFRSLESLISAHAKPEVNLRRH
jgi:hypothetical protein